LLEVLVEAAPGRGDDHIRLDPGLTQRAICGMSAQCRYQADTYIHPGWSTDLGVGPEVAGAVLNRYVAAATRGVRSLALIS
jgi:hypothetical protein